MTIHQNFLAAATAASVIAQRMITGPYHPGLEFVINIGYANQQLRLRMQRFPDGTRQPVIITTTGNHECPDCKQPPTNTG